ncbi:MAG TPA: hypothetical protein VMI54_17825, partial [Polyangiaceae bacterium]|nr:hypothetical protein [Polyangiaceae bacterium]
MHKMWAWTISGAYVAWTAGCSAHCDHMNDAASTAEPATCTNFIQRLLDCQVVAGTLVSGCDEKDP